MPTFKIRAQWYGPNGAQTGVADDTVEADSACDALDFALPGEYGLGQYTHADIRIALIEPQKSAPSPAE
jgi:hypothetical protein